MLAHLKPTTWQSLRATCLLDPTQVRAKGGPSLQDAWKVFSVDGVAQEEREGLYRAEMERLAQAERESQEQLDELRQALVASEVARDTEAREAKTKMAKVDERFRELLAKQKEDAGSESNALTELNRQFASACKLIEKLKKQLVLLSEENTKLKGKAASLAAHISTLEKVPAPKEAEVGAVDAVEGAKKLRLAQEQMAKLIGRHSKETATWSATVEQLKLELSQGKATEARLQNMIGIQESTINQLEEKVGSPPPCSGLGAWGLGG